MRTQFSAISGLDLPDYIASRLDDNSISAILQAAIEGIKHYQQLDRTTSNSHLNLFARTFDNERGILRAKTYHSVFSNELAGKDEKILALYSLLNNQNGWFFKSKKLTDCVIDKMGYGVNIKSILAAYIRKGDPDINLERVSAEITQSLNSLSYLTSENTDLSELTKTVYFNINQ